MYLAKAKMRNTSFINEKLSWNKPRIPKKPNLSILWKELYDGSLIVQQDKTHLILKYYLSHTSLV